MRTHRFVLAAAALAFLFGSVGLPAVVLAQATTQPAAPPKPLRAAKAAPSHGWWSDAVFYEVFVRSFADAREGPLAGDGKGDLRGLIERLDYLNDNNPATDSDLGVTALWLMPIQPAPSYHGYDATNYTDINPDYGSLADFKELLVQCHKRGIRVVIDLVPNHHSHLHPWFKGAEDPASPHHDWYIWSDAPPPAYKGPWGEVVWHSIRPRGPDADKGPFYYGMFSREMPDLNYRNPEVTKAMHDVARFWLGDVGVDGFRLDAIRHLIEDGPTQENTPETFAWLKDFRTLCRSINPEAFTVGEVWSDAQTSGAYVGDQLESSFAFELSFATINSVRSGDAGELVKALASTWDAYPMGQASTFLTNHDQARVMTQLKGDLPSAKLAAALLFTLPGIPFVYYGEELGMTGDKPDPKIRTPMQWGESGPSGGFTSGQPWQKLNADAATVSVGAETGDPGSLLNLYRRLIRLRRQSPALAEGDLTVLDSGDKRLLAFSRSTPASTINVIANLSSESVTPGPKLNAIFAAEPPPNSGSVLPITSSDRAFSQTGSLSVVLKPRSVYVLQSKSPAPAR